MPPCGHDLLFAKHRKKVINDLEKIEKEKIKEEKDLLVVLNLKVV
jgi:hypothetical protein